jgi:type VI secretion system protein ImpG
MDKLLSHYEQELSKLRQASQSFAQQHPQAAARIQLDSDQEVERLLQSIALLNARTAERIDDEHDDLTGAILNGHPSLRTFPSCAIAQIDYGNAKPNTISSGTRISRGTMFKSLGSPTCKFRTAYDVHIAPLTISEACLAAINVPSALRLPANATISLRITIESTHAGKSIHGERPLRVHISGAPSQTAAIMDAILLNPLCVCVQAADQWTLLPSSPFQQVGLADGESLLPKTPYYHLLTEYFCFPEKFNFIDIDLPAIAALMPSTKRLTLHVILPAATDTLRQLSRENLRLGCTPIINLFQHRAAPIKLDAELSEYILIPDQLSDTASDIYSVDKVGLLRRTSNDEKLLEFTQFEDINSSDAHWQENRSDHTLSLIDRARTALQLNTGTLSVQVTCTNRDIPQSLGCGAARGDLVTEMNTAGIPILLLDKPTRRQQLAGVGNHWGLISSLVGTSGLADLIELLRLHAPISSTATRYLLQGLTSLTSHPASAWMGTRYTRGTEYHLQINESSFTDRSIYTFAEILARYFHQDAYQGRYTQLIIHSFNGEILRSAPLVGKRSFV